MRNSFETGDRLRNTDREDRAANHRIRVHHLAVDILKSGSSLMTMAEAMAKAEAVLRREAASSSWGRVHSHERNGRTVQCSAGTNCRRER